MNVIQQWAYLLENTRLENDKLLIVKSINVSPSLCQSDSSTLVYNAFILLKTITTEKLHELVLLSIETLLKTLDLMDEETIVNILPGIMSQLTTFIVKHKEKLHHRVLIDIFCVFEKVLTMESLMHEERLVQVFELLSYYRSYPNEKVRKRFVDLSASVLLKHPRSRLCKQLVSNVISGICLEDHREYCLEYLRILKSNVIYSIEDQIYSPNPFAFVPLEFDNCVKSFYKVMISFKDSEKVSMLSLVQGMLYLNSVYPDLLPISPLSIANLIKSIQKLVVFDFQSIKILVNRSASFGENLEGNPGPWNIVKFIYLNEKDVKLINGILQVVVKTHFQGKVLEILLADVNIEETPHKSTSSLYILSQCLRESVNDVEGIVHGLINLNVLKYPCSIIEKKAIETLFKSNMNETDDLSFYNQVLLEKCIIYECIARCSARCIGCDFKRLLTYILYPLLEGLGDYNQYIHDTSLLSLQAISRNTGYESVLEMIKDNMSYVLNAIAFRIKAIESNPFAPKVLHALIAVLGEEVVVYFRDILLELMDCLDSYKNNDFVVSSVIRVYRQLVTFLKQEEAKNEKEKAYLSPAFQRLKNELKEKKEVDMREGTVKENQNSFYESQSIDICFEILEKSEFVQSNPTDTTRSNIALLCADLLKFFKNVKLDEKEKTRLLQWVHRNVQMIFKRLKHDVETPFLIQSNLEYLSAVIAYSTDMFSLKYLEKEILPIFDFWLDGRRYKKRFVATEEEMSKRMLGKATMIEPLENNVLHFYNSAPASIKWIEKDYEEGSNVQIKLYQSFLKCMTSIVENVKFHGDILMIRKVFLLILKFMKQKRVCNDNLRELVRQIILRLYDHSRGLICFMLEREAGIQGNIEEMIRLIK
jgi:hypothetical protein